MAETPFNYERPNWPLLENAVRGAGLPVSLCGEFMWMGEWREGEHQYKHRSTRLYVKLTAETTQSDASTQILKAAAVEVLRG